MDLTGPLEAVVGLAALYWLMATAASFVVEAINSILETRDRKSVV